MQCPDDTSRFDWTRRIATATLIMPVQCDIELASQLHINDDQSDENEAENQKDGRKTGGDEVEARCYSLFNHKINKEREMSFLFSLQYDGSSPSLHLSLVFLNDTLDQQKSSFIYLSYTRRCLSYINTSAAKRGGGGGACAQP